MKDSNDPSTPGTRRTPLLTGLGSVALVVGLLWFGDGGTAKYVLLATACVLYLSSAVHYFVDASRGV